MLAGVVPHAFALGAQHQRHPLRAERVLELGFGIPGEPDPPEPRLGNLIERSGEVDDPGPRHPLERAGRRLGDHPAFRRRMAVLGDDAERPERRRGAEDGADIVGVGHLVEHQQQRPVWCVGQQAIEPDIGERLDLDDHPLVRCVAGNQPAEIGRLGHGHRNILGKLHERRGFPRRPGLQNSAFWIVERRGHGMFAPQPGPVGAAVTLMRFLAPGHGLAA